MKNKHLFFCVKRLLGFILSGENVNKKTFACLYVQTYVSFRVMPIDQSQMTKRNLTTLMKMKKSNSSEIQVDKTPNL